MISSTKLDGIALVVELGRGIGREAAFSLDEAGAKVVVFADMNEERAKVTSEQSKKHANNDAYQTATFKVNVQDDKSVQDMVDFVVKEYGRLDYVVNAAGVDNGIYANIDEIYMDNYDRIMNIKARGNVVCVRAQVAAIKNQEEPRSTRRNLCHCSYQKSSRVRGGRRYD